ncbi:hypothetical protein EV702DRAFT_1043373 [Suillus placidus]|uniref:Uncharacterized protein n=1 Tax=Suillus placidus TaxID=48579 RepID=A0A9P7A029_9AGAM|nr:hypothetical protein EV702DRAFT_1043373 [Suillus placidus]
MCLRTRKGAAHPLQVFKLRRRSELIRIRRQYDRDNQQGYGFREPSSSVFASRSMVKKGKQLKSQWSAIRRQITPKVGELCKHTIDSIMRKQKPSTFKPKRSSPPKNEALYLPLAMYAARMLGTPEGLPDIFFAKLVQRSGVTAWNDKEHTKRWDTGLIMARKRACRTTSNDTHVKDGVGTMRVYFLILATPVPQPLDKMFHLPRFWTLSLLNSVAALDVGGMEAKFIWGNKWVKTLQLLDQGTTTNINCGAVGKLVAGRTPEEKDAYAYNFR